MKTAAIAGSVFSIHPAQLQAGPLLQGLRKAYGIAQRHHIADDGCVGQIDQY